MLLSILLWGLVTLLLLLISYCLLKYAQHWLYFRHRGLPYYGADFKILFDFFSGRTTMVSMEKELYSQMSPSGPAVGMSEFFFTGKTVYVSDPELLKLILVKDFDHFPNHRSIESEESNLYLKKMLFFMEGDPWRSMRGKLSPSFSTAKIRKMFDIFAKSGERCCDYVKTHIVGAASGGGGDFDFNLVVPKVTMDVISSCALGVDSKCFSVPPSGMAEFEDTARRFQIQLGFTDIVKILLVLYAPKVADVLGIEAFDGGAQTYFANVIKRVMKLRRQNAEQPWNDFLQLMMDTQKGVDMDMEHEGGGEVRVPADGVMDDDDIVANCLIFLMGGFETTNSLMLFSLYALATEEEVQDKVYVEVKGALDKAGGVLTYEAIQEMSYLDLFLNETLRVYPPQARIDRVCTKNYTIPGTKTVIEKGTLIIIPIYPLHHDPKYYSHPERFQPERFLPEAKSARNPMCFAPFGHGPRACIGNRFALVETKAVIAKLVYTFQFGKCGKTLVPMEFATSMDVKPKGGMWLRVTPRK